MSDRAAGRSERAARILIVDDHPVVREGLGIRIARQPDLEVCGEAAGVAEALALIDATDPDVAVIDISLGTGDGLDLIHRIRSRNARVRLLVWSMYSESLYAERALRAGAMGYLNKQETTGRIIEAIRSVLDGQMYFSGPITDRILRRAAGNKGSSEQCSASGSLTDRELEVFHLIGQGLSTAEVASRLHLSIHTIETYRQRIKAKLGLRTSAELVCTAVHWVLEQS